MSAVAIIPARGGSKRILRKNIKKFLHQPIICYSIETALNSKLFDEVMVSTDDLEIAEIALQYGATVPFLRSEQTAGDYIGTFDVLAEVLHTYSVQGNNFDTGCCIYPTAPLLTKETLLNGYNTMIENNYDVVFPVLEFSFPIWRSLALDVTDKKKVQFQWPENALKRSQDLPRAFHDAGQFYWFNSKTMLSKGSLLTDHTGAVFITEMEAQDIDNLSDWELAEFKYLYRKRNQVEE